MAPRNKVNAGDKLTIQADEYNGFLEMFDRYRHGEVKAEPRTEPRQLPGGLIRIKNLTGVPLLRYNIVAIPSPLWSASDDLQAFKNHIIGRGVLPSCENQGRLAIVQELGDNGAIIPAIACGLTCVRVLVTDLTHEWATPIEGEHRWLTSSDSGPAYIVYPPPAYGVQWLVVRLGNPPVDYYCSEPSSSSSSSSIYLSSSSSSLTSSGTYSSSLTSSGSSPYSSSSSSVIAPSSSSELPPIGSSSSDAIPSDSSSQSTAGPSSSSSGIEQGPTLTIPTAIVCDGDCFHYALRQITFPVGTIIGPETWHDCNCLDSSSSDSDLSSSSSSDSIIPDSSSSDSTGVITGSSSSIANPSSSLSSSSSDLLAGPSSSSSSLTTAGNPGTPSLSSDLPSSNSTFSIPPTPSSSSDLPSSSSTFSVPPIPSSSSNPPSSSSTFSVPPPPSSSSDLPSSSSTFSVPPPPSTTSSGTTPSTVSISSSASAAELHCMEFYREYTVNRGSGDETLEVAISLDHCATIDDVTSLSGNVITSCTDPMQVVFSASSSTIPTVELDTITCDLFEDATYIETVPNGGTATISFQNVEAEMQLPGGWTLVSYTDIQCGMSGSCDCVATSSSSSSSSAS